VSKSESENAGLMSEYLLGFSDSCLRITAGALAAAAGYLAETDNLVFVWFFGREAIEILIFSYSLTEFSFGLTISAFFDPRSFSGLSSSRNFPKSLGAFVDTSGAGAGSYEAFGILPNARAPTIESASGLFLAKTIEWIVFS